MSSEQNFINDPLRISKTGLTKIMSTFEDLRRDGLLFDIAIKIKDRKFYVHRVILSIMSYFYSLFHFGVLSPLVPGSNIPEVELPEEVDPDSFTLILEFIYTGCTSIDCKNVQPLFMASNYLGHEDLERVCRHYIVSNLTPSNALDILQLSINLNDRQLMNDTNTYIRENYLQIFIQNDFISLDYNLLTHLLDLNSLISENEQYLVFQKIISWVKSDISPRINYLRCLLDKVIIFLNKEFILNTLMIDETVHSSGYCIYAIRFATQVNRWFGLFLRSHTDCIHCGQRIYALGTPNSSESDMINLEILNPNSSIWTEYGDIKCGSMFLRRLAFASVLLGRKLFIIGGSIKGVPSNLVCFLHFKTSVGLECLPSASLHYARLNPGCTILNGHIYVGGGFNNIPLSSVEVFNPSDDSWTFISPMNESRAECRLVSNGRSLFAIGGYNKFGSLPSVELYDTNTDTWIKMASMHSKRYSFGAAYYDGKIIVCGGYDGRRSLSSVEIYDISTNIWMEVSPMAVPRNGISLVHVGDRLYALGGYRGVPGFNNLDLAIVEFYDIKFNIWRRTYDMSGHRGEVNAVVGPALHLMPID